MKIRALRVAAFRRFADGAAVEDIADGINVLAGPNEMGKSTLFHALESAFLVPYRATGARIDAMRPRGGGEPLVEVEFEQAGQRWRLRKQFGRGAAVSLADATGRTVARNADAEDKLAGLLGRTGELAGPLGLVWVKQQRSLLAPDPDLDPETGKTKVRGERTALMDTIGAELDAAVSGDLFETVQQKAKTRLDALLTPNRNALRKHGPLDVARRERDQLANEYGEARNAALAARGRLDRIAAATQQLEALEAPGLRAESEALLQGLQARAQAASDARARGRLALETAKLRDAELANARQQAAAHDALQRELSGLEQKHAAAVALQAGIDDSAQALSADAATPTALDRLLAAEHARDLSDAQLSAQAAHVTVTLARPSNGRLRIDGQEQSQDSSLEVADSVLIEADGIASIKIAAADAAKGAALKAARDAQNRQVEAGLAALGVATIAEAKARGEARQQRAQALDQARAKLSALAPQGLAALAQTLAALQAKRTPPAAEPQVLAQLEEAAQAARQAADAAVREALSEEAFKTLQGELANAQAQAQQRAASIARLKADISNAKAEQAGADEDGRAGRADTLAGELERAEAEYQRLDREARALRYLENTLADIEAKARAAYFTPVTNRLAPHVARVFGPSEVSFRDSFALDVLVRGAAREDFTSLSDGTREQLSVLVRLSFAELLADRGAPVPLVLDDPLVYSDDERLAAVCAALGAAAAVPQILVLTCRPSAFSKLPGRRLELSPWRPGI